MAASGRLWRSAGGGKGQYRPLAQLQHWENSRMERKNITTHLWQRLVRSVKKWFEEACQRSINQKAEDAALYVWWEVFVTQLYCHAWEPSAAVMCYLHINHTIGEIDVGAWFPKLFPACLHLYVSSSLTPTPAACSPQPPPYPTSHSHLDASEQMWTEPYVPLL